MPLGYPDPRGLACLPEQVIVTAGYIGAPGLPVAALHLGGQAVVPKRSGFPRTRSALAYAGMKTLPVPVNAPS